MRAHALVGATSFDQALAAGSIDAYIFADLEDNGIAPAPKTTDWEFIRRISLDLTGRIPAPDRVLGFVSDTGPDKRAKLIEELLAKPEWIDKWTMYFGDLYQNTSFIQSANVYRNSLGRNAFYQWIYDSLSQGRPYNQMASDLITASAGDTYSNGAMNWLVSGVLILSPKQDTADQMTANVFDTFLGLAHVNCVLCHDGRGHLDGVSLWGSSATRYQSWQLASFFSHTGIAMGSGNSWLFHDNVPGYGSDYALNTTTGNRPLRKPSGACDAGTSCNYVAPQYIFTGDSPQPGGELPGSARTKRHRRFPICAGHRQLHLGGVLRQGDCGSARCLRSGAPRSRQSSTRSLDTAAFERVAVECAGPAFHRWRL